MPIKLPIYMDYHATTPVDPRVLEVMAPYFCEKFGNPASVTHSFGWEAQEAVELSRAQISGAIGADPKEIIFTSGATESDNLALKGVAHALASRGNHMIVSAVEHNAVLDCAQRLEQEGFKITYLPVDEGGLVDPGDVRAAVTDRTILVSVMTANNEIGTLQPIHDIGRITKERGIYFHTDASQALGKIPIDVNDAHVDLLSLSAHKIYGPKGIGALYVRRYRPRVKLTAMIDGGGHEQGLRSGTLPVPLVVGFGEAVTLAMAAMKEESSHLSSLRDRLMHTIMEKLEGVRINGSLSPRLPNNLNLSFEGTDAEAVLTSMNKEVALSSGSACTSAEVRPSHVLIALGLEEARAQASIRFGLGRWTTSEEVDYVAGRIVEAVTSLRRLAPKRPIPVPTGRA